MLRRSATTDLPAHRTKSLSGKAAKSLSRPSSPTDRDLGDLAISLPSKSQPSFTMTVASSNEFANVSRLRGEVATTRPRHRGTAALAAT